MRTFSIVLLAVGIWFIYASFDVWKYGKYKPTPWVDDPTLKGPPTMYVVGQTDDAEMLILVWEGRTVMVPVLRGKALAGEAMIMSP